MAHRFIPAKFKVHLICGSKILESIEKGLEEERGKGTLKPDEVKVCCNIRTFCIFSNVIPLICVSPCSVGSSTEAHVAQDEAE